MNMREQRLNLQALAFTCCLFFLPAPSFATDGSDSDPSRDANHHLTFWERLAIVPVSAPACMANGARKAMDNTGQMVARSLGGKHKNRAVKPLLLVVVVPLGAAVGVVAGGVNCVRSTFVGD